MNAPSGEAARARRVASLYDEVITRVIERLRVDVQNDGLDEEVLVELRRRWYQKLEASGALPSIDSIANAIGGGQSLIAPQYAQPDASTAVGGVSTRPRDRAADSGASSSAGGGAAGDALRQHSAGLPRGAHLYSGLVVMDGEPAARMDPPPQKRPRPR